MKSLSLNTRLFIYSIIFCIAGVVMVGAYSYHSARNALVERTLQQLTSLRAEKKARIESFFNDREREIVLAANDDEFINFLLNLSAEKTGLPKKDIINSSRNKILQYIANSGIYSGILLYLPGGRNSSLKIDQDGNISGYYSINHSFTIADSLIKKRSRSKVSVFDFIKGPLSNEYYIYLAYPIQNPDSSTGKVLLFEVSEKTINTITSELTTLQGQGRTGEVYLVGDDYLMRSSSRFYDKSVLSISCKSELVEKALKGGTGTGKTSDYRNQMVLSSYSPLSIKGLNWVILSDMDWDEALLQISILGKRILLISFAVFLMLTIGVYILSRRITAPLLKLKEAASKVGEGNFDQILPVSRNDEIGHLTQVFNRMTLQLKHTTNRLKEREQRLTHFYQATVDGILLHKNGAPVLINHALSNLTGYDEFELMKKSPGDFLVIQEDVLVKVQSKPNASFEAILKSKSGQKIPVEVQKSIVQFHGQEVESLVIRDISRRKAIEEELQTERLRQMRSVIDGQEQERQRLSRELHDGLGQTLVAIKLKLESIPVDEMGNQRKTLESVKQMFNHTIEEIRRMSNNLMPAALTEFSLAVVLRNLCTEVESNSGINVSLVIGVLPDSLSQILKTYTYRIVQEALNNIVKHSGASRAVVSIFSDISKLYLHIEDDGIGFNSSKGFESGNGLYNMKERAILLNGKFEIISSKGNGVKIQVEFPLFPKPKG